MRATARHGKLGVVGCAVLVLAGARSVAADEGPVERLHLPYTAWAKPLARGPIKVFFGSENVGHQVLWNGLQEVISLDARCYAIHGWGAMTWALNEVLRQRFELYILTSTIWKGFSGDQRSFILRQVHNGGSGLMLMSRPDGSGALLADKPDPNAQPDLAPIVDAKQGDLTKALVDYVARSLPVEVLGMEFDFIARQWGKGRVVWVGWGDFSPYAPLTENSWKAPDPPWPFEAAEDYALAASARIMLWTVGREAGAGVQVSIGGREAAIMLATDKGVDAVECRLRNDRGVALYSWQLKERGGKLKLPDLPAGTYLVDAFAIRKNAKIEWASASLNVASPIRVTAIALGKEAYRPFETISGTAEIASEAGGPAKCNVLVQLIDAHERLVDTFRRTAALEQGRGTVPFLLSVGPPVTAKHTVRATVIVDGRPRHSLSVWCTAVDRSGDSDGFHAFTLMLTGRTSNPYYMHYLRAKGVTGVNGEHSWDMALDADLRVFHNFHTIGNKVETLREIIRATRRYSPIGYLYSDEAPMSTDDLGVMKSAISTLDRSGRGGLSGVCATGTKDAPGFVSNLDFYISYTPPSIFSPNFWQGPERKLMRSFIADDAVWGTWTGYFPWGDLEQYNRAQPWTMLFCGANMISLFMQHSAEPWWHQLTDGSLTQEARWLLEEVRELQGGIARQVQGIRRVRPRIAIYWPKSRTKEAYGWLDGLNGFCFALDDLGCDYDFVSEQEIQRGELVSRRYSVLIMPQCVQSIDPRRPAEFVRQGGLLIADTRIAIQDADGAFADTSAWDGLLGITRAKPLPDADEQATQAYLHSEIPVTVSADSPIPGLAGWKGECLGGEPGVRPVEGKGVSHAGYTGVAGQGQGAQWVEDFVDSPAVIVNRHGEGATIYLNFRLRSENPPSYVPDREKLEPHKANRRTNAGLLAALFSLVKIDNYNAKATDPAGNPLPYTVTYPFKEGAVRLFGLVQQTFLNWPDRTNEDKTTEQYYLHGPAGYDSKPAIITFPERGHIYDVRAGKYMGQADRIEAQITAGRAELYAVLDHRVNGLTVSAPDTATASVRFVFEALLQTGGAPGRHAIRAEWLDPDGKPVGCYAQNLFGKGGAAGWMQFALNDTPGTWKLRATDVISGVSAEQAVKVRAPNMAETERSVPQRPAYTVTREPFRIDPLKGGSNPGNVVPVKPEGPEADRKEPPVLTLTEPYIQQKGCFIFFPGQPYHQVVQVWEAAFRPGPLEYYIKWAGHRGNCDYGKTVEPSDAPVLDSALGMEGPLYSPDKEKWLSWTKLGFIHVSLDGQDIKTPACKPRKVDDSTLEAVWEAEKATILLRLAAVKGSEELLARLEITAGEQVDTPVVTLHNRAGGASPVGEFWHAMTARRDDALGSELSLPDEAWVVFADRAMNRAQRKGCGVCALLIAPDPAQVIRAHIQKVGDEPEPTGHDTRHRRCNHMINTAITLAPIPAGGTRTLSFALWEWPDRANAEARRYVSENAARVLQRLGQLQE